MSKQKLETLKEKYDAIQEIGTDVQIPFHVARFTSTRGSLLIFGDQVSIGTDDADFGSLEECRQAIEWYVQQLGGAVKWQK
jgi:hypothetical protein